MTGLRAIRLDAPTRTRSIRCLGRSRSRAGSARGSAAAPALLIIALIWLLPTVSLLVSSFRPANEVTDHRLVERLHAAVPVHAGQLLDVLTRNNMGTSFLNSLFITIPATVIPILVAAYAAYAFAWMDFPAATSSSCWWSACSWSRSSRP